MQYICNTSEQNDKIFSSEEFKIWKKMAYLDNNIVKVEKYVFEFKEMDEKLENT